MHCTALKKTVYVTPRTSDLNIFLTLVRYQIFYITLHYNSLSQVRLNVAVVTHVHKERLDCVSDQAVAEEFAGRQLAVLHLAASATEPVSYK